MARWTHFYLIRIEFLGFRYHGWQKQGELKTVQGQLDKTFGHIFGHTEHRTLGCSRTDAKVSADDFVLELFINEFIENDELLAKLNDNLPQDIRAKSVTPTDADFNIIQNSKIKEYHYTFCFGEKSHPFNAPFIINFGKHLNIELMQEAVKLFKGTHNFKRYVSHPTENTIFEREVLTATIEKNTKLSGNFIAENSYIFKVSSKGFLRYQVRLMMGALVDIGRGDWTIEQLKESLENFEGPQCKHIVPSSGLNLHRVEF